MIIGEKLPKNSIFIFAVHKKGSKSNFMEQNTFFRKIRNLRWQTSELQNIVFSLSQTCWDTLYNSESQQVLVKEETFVLTFLAKFPVQNLLGTSCTALKIN